MRAFCAAVSAVNGGSGGRLWSGAVIAFSDVVRDRAAAGAAPWRLVAPLYDPSIIRDHLAFSRCILPNYGSREPGTAGPHALAELQRTLQYSHPHLA